MPTSFSPAEFGFVRVAACVPELRVADVAFNATQIIALARDAAARGAHIALFPELSITSYTSADLFYQDRLLNGARQAVQDIARELAQGDLGNLFVVVGLPLEVDGKIYNCAAMLHHGVVVGLIPKTYLPSTNEYYESRWFTRSIFATTNQVRLGNAEVPFGPDLLFELVDAATDVTLCKVGIEVCEDLWAVTPLSNDQALAGATILLNPSASVELLGKAEYRRELVKQQAARCLAAYAYAGSGPGESTTDVVFGGHALIAENGSLLTESDRFSFESHLVVADVDVDRLNHERRVNSSFSQATTTRHFRVVRLNMAVPEQQALLRHVVRTPFVPSDMSQRAANCREIFAIQATGLARRLRHTNSKNITIGVSGGLDSTLALLVVLKAFEKLNKPLSGIHAITMPGFGTTNRTKNNAIKLAELLGITIRTIPIADSVRQHFKDIGHAETLHDITYENAQARERTQILMDVANQIGGFVVGTGDLSELALGWMTFNADHMSMYHVNAGVPKTLVRYIIDWCAEAEYSGEASAVLHDIADTPISPELLPLDDRGNLQQQTEESIGPYLLHDFFLFQVVRNGFEPRKVFFLAQQAFAGPLVAEGAAGNAGLNSAATTSVMRYDDVTLLKWLRNFYKRFWANQFKRSAMPDGPKVGTVALSPRGDWRMPSDASAAAWLAEVDAIEQELNLEDDRAHDA